MMLIPCKFGSNCRDKNKPEHNTRYSHPSEGDNAPVKQACKWGAACRDIHKPEHCSRFSHPGEGFSPAPRPEGAHQNLTPCKFGDKCRVKSIDHCSRYSHPATQPADKGQGQGKNMGGGNDKARNLIFAGNPGAGKSTLMNSLMGAVRFKAGVSIGKGMTFRFDKWTSEDGCTYMDTPGLADPTLRQKAAEAIAEALRSGGWYRVFFVVTLEAGRIRPDDVTTIRLVMQTSQDILDYGLIINKVSGELAKKLSDPKTMNSLLDLIFNDPNIPRTSKVYVNSKKPSLEDKDDVYEPAPMELKQFVQSVKDSYVRGEKVQDLKWNEFEELKDAAAAAELKLMEQAKKMDDQTKKMQQQQKLMDDINRQREKDKRDADERFRLIEKERLEAEKQHRDAMERAKQMAAKDREKFEQEQKAKLEKIQADAKAEAQRMKVEADKKAAELKAQQEQQQKKFDEEKKRTEQLERERAEKDRKLEEERAQLQRERDEAEATKKKMEETNKKLAQYGFFLNCRIKATSQLIWEKSGEHMCDAGHGGVIKGHVRDAHEDDKGKARASVDWDNGETSSTPYDCLARA